MIVHGKVCKVTFVFFRKIQTMKDIFKKPRNKPILKNKGCIIQNLKFRQRWGYNTEVAS